MTETKDTPIRWVHRPFREDQDLSSVLSLRESVFGEPAYDARRWHWQYRENPDGQKLFIDLAVDRDDPNHLAGHYAVLPSPIRYGRRTMFACQSLDTFTDPEYRNQRIFTGLAEFTYKSAADAGAMLIYGFPNKNSYRGMTGRLRFVETARLWAYHLPLRVGAVTRRLRRLPSIPAVDSINLPGADRLPLWPGEFRRVDDAAPDWDEFLVRASDRFEISIARSAAYYRWRFFTCTARQYQVYELRREAQLAGIGVISIENGSGQPIGVLADFMASDRRSWLELLAGLIGAARRAGAYTVLTLAHLESPIATYLRMLGFIRNRWSAPAPLVVRRLEERTAGPDVFNARNWFLTPGDTDFY